jgi:hypothetical protein
LMCYILFAHSIHFHSKAQITPLPNSDVFFRGAVRESH